MKIDPKMKENSLNFDPQARLGAVLGTSGRQSGSRCGLDCLWNSIWRPPGSHLGAKMGQDGTKMVLCWPTCRLRWPTWHHFGQHFGAFWASWDQSFFNFFRKWRKCENEQPSITFASFFVARACETWFSMERKEQEKKQIFSNSLPKPSQNRPQNE